MLIYLITLFISQTQAQTFQPLPPKPTLLTLRPATLIFDPCKFATNNQLTYECRVGCATCVYPNQECVLTGSSGCSCLPGYVINTADNNACVPVNSTECLRQRYYSIIQIPPTCRVNEQFVYCGVCDATCAKPCICGRCVCLDGYLRDKYGYCIPADSFNCINERRIIVWPEPI